MSLFHEKFLENEERRQGGYTLPPATKMSLAAMAQRLNYQFRQVWKAHP